jgi:flagellar hook assembly protein FlgD
MRAGRLLPPVFGVILLGALPSAAIGTNVCGTYTTNQTWTTGGSPYSVTCSVSIGGAAAPVLTINAGVTVKFNSGTSLLIANGGAGGINVQGTSAQHVTFTASSGLTPGYWDKIQLLASTTATSSITYADVFYSAGGILFTGSGSPTFSNVKVQYASGTGFTVQAGSPTISATTLSNNQWGLSVTGGTPTINSSSTISNNTVGGVWVTSPAAPSLQTVTISGNTGYAMSQDGAVTFGTMSGITVSGNTTNGIEVRGSTISTNTTWKSFSVPLVATNWVSVAGGSSPVLTIQAGVTVKFTSGGALLIANGGTGGIAAIGTAAQPITFTANTNTPVAGYWWGLQLYARTTAGSTIQYASVNYASGIQVTGSSPTIDHVTLNTNGNAGITTNNAAPSIKNCNFIGNSAGLVNKTPAVAVDARLNWWNSALGPSGNGPGTGQSVSAGVLFGPWLAAAGSSPQYITAFSLANLTFNPTIGINANFSFTTTQSGSWTLTVTNSSSQVVRTITGTGTTGVPGWDGKNGSAVLQPNGVYTYQVTSVAGANTASPASGRVTLDTTKQLTLTSVVLAPAFLSPNADGAQDTATISAVSSFDGASWTLSIKNSGGTIVRSASGSANPNISYAWDGKNASAAVQPDGIYTFLLTVTDGTASTSASPAVTLDDTLPAATITVPTGSQTLSNVYQTGSAVVNVTGTATDTNFNTWSVDYGAGPAPSSWTSLATGTAAVSSGTFVAWNTLTLANGAFTVRLLVRDQAGNSKTATKTVTVGNFSVSKNTTQFNGGTSGTVTYTSIVPFTLTETLSIKNQSGLTVRTLVSAVSRGAGTYTDVWNGKNGSSVLQPDGGYFDVANVTAGASSMTWDLTNQFVGGGFAFSQDSFFYNLPPFMPYNNIPLNLVPQVLTVTGRQYWLFVADLAVLNPESPALCNQPPSFCTTNGDYRATNGTFQYSGTDRSGKFRPDIIACVLMNDLNSFSKNAVVLYGTMPSVTNVTASPSLFSPRGGAQKIAFDVATFQNQTTTVTITLKNQESLTVLRTLTLSSQTPGHVTTTWDGKAGNGMWVAPGGYVVEVTAADSLGNAAGARMLTTVSY